MLSELDSVYDTPEPPATRRSVLWSSPRYFSCPYGPSVHALIGTGGLGKPLPSTAVSLSPALFAFSKRCLVSPSRTRMSSSCLASLGRLSSIWSSGREMLETGREVEIGLVSETDVPKEIELQTDW